MIEKQKRHDLRSLFEGFLLENSSTRGKNEKRTEPMVCSKSSLNVFTYGLFTSFNSSNTFFASISITCPQFLNQGWRKSSNIFDVCVCVCLKKTLKYFEYIYCTVRPCNAPLYYSKNSLRVKPMIQSRQISHNSISLPAECL